jgi:dihydroorotase-like cyclic amidohydrolase
MRSGSRAAALGGITTVGNIAYPAVAETPTATIARAAAEAAPDAVVDFVVHPVVVDPVPAVLDDLPVMAAAGHTSRAWADSGETLDGITETMQDLEALP